MATGVHGFQLALPHPYYTRYRINELRSDSSAPTKFSIHLDDSPSQSSFKPIALPKELHHADLYFSSLTKGEEIPLKNNTQFARARRSPFIVLEWKNTPLTIGQAWLFIYFIFSLEPEIEQFRLRLFGPEKQLLEKDLKAVGLAIQHPAASSSEEGLAIDEILVLRSMFWQGAGSPFGPRSIWLADSALSPLAQYPPLPFSPTLSNKFPSQPIYALHPTRPAKPQPGSVIYSRYIPHLKEHFEMVALDYEDEIHFNLFHVWQNDPRVAAGWNETGTREEHKVYLQKLGDDPHTFTVLARFGGTFFAYFEIYWGAEDTLGAHYASTPYDRGRHSLVGDSSFRGPHRVSAWWSSLMHYMFLDEPRTTSLIGEPKATNSRVLAYDLAHGFHIEKWVDYGHKRSAMVRCTRERFFETTPLEYREGVVEKAEEWYVVMRGSKL